MQIEPNVRRTLDFDIEENNSEEKKKPIQIVPSLNESYYEDYKCSNFLYNQDFLVTMIPSLLIILGIGGKV